MKSEDVLETYLICVFEEFIKFTMDKIGRIDPETGKTYDIYTLVQIAFLLKEDPETREIEYKRSPLFKALFCLSIELARNSRKRKKVKN